MRATVKLITYCERSFAGGYKDISHLERIPRQLFWAVHFRNAKCIAYNSVPSLPKHFHSTDSAVGALLKQDFSSLKKGLTPKRKAHPVDRQSGPFAFLKQAGNYFRLATSKISRQLIRCTSNRSARFVPLLVLQKGKKLVPNTGTSFSVELQALAQISHFQHPETRFRARVTPGVT